MPVILVASAIVVVMTLMRMKSVVVALRMVMTPSHGDQSCRALTRAHVATPSHPLGVAPTVEYREPLRSCPRNQEGVRPARSGPR